MLSKRISCMGMAFLMVLGLASSVKAQDDYPNKPVKIVIPFGPGSTMEVVSRILSESLSKDLKVDIPMEYKAGGSGMIGVDSVAKGRPDGYNVLCGTNGTLIFAPVVTPGTTPYDPVKDLAPIAFAGQAPNVLFVNSQSPFKRFEDLLDNAKKNPGKLNCATIGVGSVAHFILELMNMSAGTKIVHVPYKEAGQNMTAVLAGETDFGIMAASGVIPQVRAGKLRVLVATGKLSDVPEAPTLTDKKLPQAAISSWFGYLVHVKTPKAVQDRLVSAFSKAIKDPENGKKLEKAGVVAEYMAPAEFGKMIKSQLETITKAAKAANIIK